MKDNMFLRLLSSIPIILIFLYFIPFLGICLIVLRLFMYNNKKRNSTPIILISIGVLILAPILLNFIFNLIKFDKTVISHFNEILDSKIYATNLIKYSKLLITTGVILLIISFVINSIFNKLGNSLKSYISNQEKRDAEIFQKNNLIMKVKQENAKNTSVVYCPYCGADNMLTSNVGLCKYCRRKIKAKK